VQPLRTNHSMKMSATESDSNTRTWRRISMAEAVAELLFDDLVCAAKIVLPSPKAYTAVKKVLRSQALCWPPRAHLQGDWR